MRYYLLILSIVSITAALVFFNSLRKDPPDGTAEKNGFAVIELFTSEGCSSCPPADEAVKAVAEKFKGSVYVLGFHVDYWDRLGWKDQFSNAMYSERQREYAGVFGLESVYTPQIVINGKEEFTGSDNNRLHKTVKQQLALTANEYIDIKIGSQTGNKLTLAYETNSSGDYVLNIALIQLHATTRVQRGENSGLQLSHINIVRDFKTLKNNKGTTGLEIPAELSKADCKLICYLQDSSSLQITAAREMSLH